MTRIVVAALVFVLAAASQAQTISLPTQGRLLDASDRPVTGRLSVRFTLYPEASGDSELWSETSEVAFDNGFFSSHLGLVTPLDPELFDGSELYLSIKIGNEPALEPRLKLAWVPFAVRALEARSMKGGTIENATITGGSIAGASIEATSLSASSIDINGRPVSAETVPLAGGTMTGPLAAPTIVSTTTSGPPLEVSSSVKVANLNADLFDGKDSAEFWTKSEHVASDFTNLVNNGAFDNFRDGNSRAPNWWTLSIPGVVEMEPAGHAGRGVRIRDLEPTATVALTQEIFPASNAPAVGSVFSASVRFKRITETGTGRLCLRQSPTVQTCTSLSASSSWQVATVTHTVVNAPQFLQLVLSPSSNSVGDMGEYVFDEAIVVRGSLLPDFRPSPRDLIVPSGMLGLFPFACPSGWARYDKADGRTIVGARTTGYEVQQGTALANNGTRVITEVPSHTHRVNPPPTITDSQGAHTHSIDPPSTNTLSAGAHTHYWYTYNDDYNGSGNGNRRDLPGVEDDSGDVNTRYTRETSSAGAHTHNIDIGPFNSENTGSHTHSVDIAEFTSSVTGTSSVDVTMPYVQLAVCQAL